MDDEQSFHENSGKLRELHVLPDRMKTTPSPAHGHSVDEDSRVEFHLRHSDVFPTSEENENAEFGFVAPKMTHLKQSLSPSKGSGRTPIGRQAEICAALNAYFQKVGWTPSFGRSKNKTKAGTIHHVEFGSPNLNEAA